MADTVSIAVSADAPPPRRPPLRLTVAEASALLRPSPAPDFSPLLATSPRGDGHAVLLLPALGRGDPYTAALRKFLQTLGYAACPWGQGVNTGPHGRLMQGAAARLTALAGRHGPVSIIGFSMGGLFARWLALRMPDQVRQVITVCSPIHDPARNFWLPLEPFLGMWGGRAIKDLALEIARPLPVPCTVVYSRDDGLVNWSACPDASCPADCLEITGPHVLIARNAEVVRLIAQRLSAAPPAARAVTPAGDASADAC